jgi:hypothetical protein
MTLFEECLAALGKGVIVLSEEESCKLFENMDKDFPITSWGRINWEKVKHAEHVQSINEITKNIGPADAEVYLLWDEASLPAIKTNIKKIFEVLDDVTAVSFDTWIYNPRQGYVIEFYHENEIMLGWR